MNLKKLVRRASHIRIKKRTWVALWIIALVLPISIKLFLKPQETEASWWNPSWMYRQVLTVNNSGSNISEERKIKIDLDTAALITAGKLQSDCDDLRFTNQNGQLLDYFINTDVAGCNNASTDVYVKIDRVLAGDQNIYIYYGNSSIDNTGGTKKNLFFADSTEGQGLLGYWKLDEQVSGNAQSVTDYAYTNDGTTSDINSTGMDCTISGKLSYGCNFDGTDDYIQFPSIANIRSISMFIYINSGQESGGWDYIFDARDGLSNGWFSDYSVGTNWNVMYVNGESKTPSWSNIPKDQWVHLYVQSNTSFTDNVTLMARYGQTENAQGRIDDLRFYSRTLTTDEISSIYNNGAGKAIATPATFTPNSSSFSSEQTSDAGPIAYWKFDEGYGTTANDSAGNNDGTISGMTWADEAQCISGKCVFNESTSNSMSVSDNSSLDLADEMSISFWWKPMTQHSDFADRIVRKWTGTTDANFVLYFFGNYNDTEPQSEGILKMYANNGGSWGQVSDAYQVTDSDLGKWMQVTFTYNSTDGGQLYINGQAIGSRYGSGSLATNSEDILVGMGHQMYFDEFKIYPFEISPDQIKQDYNKGQAVSLGAKDTGPLSDGLVGYWKMDEASWNGTSGEVIDASGNSNNGTSVNGATTGTGKYGSAGNFDGTDDYATVPSSGLIASEGTISLWFNRTSTNTETSYILSSTSSGGNRTYLSFSGSSNNLRLTMGSSATIVGSAAITNGQWYHATVVWKDDQASFYINGSLINSSSFTALTGINATYYFATYSSAVQLFNGLIDEVRFYNRALSANEVTDLYHYAPGPVGYWKMDEGSGTTAYDSSGNGNYGTLDNSPTWTQGKFGGGIDFDGANNQSVDITGSQASNFDFDQESFTVSAWVKPRSGHNSMIVRKGQGTLRTGYGLLLNTSNQAYMIYSDTYDSGDHRTYIGNITADEWVYLTQVVDKSTNTSTGYINGVELANVDISGITPDTSAFSLLIGEDNAYDADAVIDEVKIYDYARTPQQIVEDMNAGHPAGGSPVGSQLAYWKFDEGYGQTTNDSVGSNNGTLGADSNSGSDDPTWESASECKINKCSGFNGSQHILLSESVSLPQNSFSVSAWIKTTSTGDEKIFSTGVSYHPLQIFNGRLRICVNGCSIGSTVNDDSWHYVVVVGDNTSIRAYIDGSTTPDIVQTTSSTIMQGIPRIGAVGADSGSTPGSLAFNGLIDEVKIYSSALTEEQIKTDYNAGLSTGYGVAGPSEASILDDGEGNPPVAEWNFDENTGTTINDISGNGHTGTFNGNWGIGKISSAGDFNGSSHYANVTGMTGFGSTNYTLEGWINYRTQPSNYSTMIISSTSGFVLYINQTNQHPYAQMYNGTGWTAISCTDFTASANEWNHLALTYDDSTTSMDLYFNGQKCGGPTTVTGGFNDSYNTTFNIGTYASNYHDGLIDNVKVYDYARTPAQIAYDYNRGKPIAHWRMDECQGTTINDASGNGNDGTLTIGATGTQTTVGTCSTSGAWANGASGKFSSAMSFDGTDDYVNISDNGDLEPNNITISTWVNWNSISDDWIIAKQVSDPTNYNYGYLLRSDTPSNNISCRVGLGTTSAGAGGQENLINPGSWKHIVCTYDGNTIKLYLDGKLIGSAVQAGTIDYTSVGNLTIGGTTSRYIDAKMDDTRIYNYALSADQVKQMTNEGFGTRFGD